MADFNCDVDNVGLKGFKLKSLKKIPPCFKNARNAICINLMLTNSYKCFQNSCVIEAELSDFHKMTLTVMKTHFQKQKPKFMNYSDYRNFSERE